MVKRIVVLTCVLAGCSGTDALRDLRPEIDASPLSCGYKWFQSGYGPTIQCDGGETPLRDEQVELARAHAWEIAEQRCPAACAPVELQDTVEGEDRFPNGACRDGRGYFTTRFFFQCGR